MSLIVALFCIGSITNAPTLAAPLVDPTSSNPTSVFISTPTASTKQKSTWEILWTCLATIFACTWVSVHPNIPSYKDGRIRIALQRLELMVWAILTPEMIIFWAMRQWRHARALTKLYEGYYGWTITHSHFLLMGGFVLAEGTHNLSILAEGAHDISVLTPKDFRKLLADQEIGFPLISEKEIQDRSKGDGLSKALAVVQTTWFLAQCISRKVQGLTITELEIVTVAFAFLNGIMYFLWWSKPVGVTTSVRIYRLTSPIPQSPTICIARDRNSRTSTAVLTLDFSSNFMNSADQISLTNSIPIPQITTPPMAHHDRPPSPSFESDSIHLDLDFASRLAAFSQKTPPSYNNGWLISKHLMRTFLFIFHRLNEMRGKFETHSWTEPTRIPTFFPFEDDHDHRLKDHADQHDHCRVAIISLLFGLIHCLGWSLVFPSGAERLVWRVSAVIIAALPVLILFLYSFGLIVYFEWLAYDFESAPKSRRREQLKHLFSNWIVKPTTGFRKAIWWIFIILIPIYLVARMVLLVEAFLSLRSLPSGAYSVVNWTEYLPHI